MAQAAPSTAPANPLEESLAKIMGEGLSGDTGTSPLTYENQGFRQPQADVINISGSPGTGATTAETWSHDIALENLRREQLQFEYEQQQNEIANALRQQEAMRAQAESARAAEQLGLTKQTTASQLAAAQQQMVSEAQRQKAAEQAYKYATTGEARAAQQAQQDYAVKTQQMALAKAAEDRAAAEWYAKTGGIDTAAKMEAARRAQGAQMGPAYYVPGNTGVTYYSGGRPAPNAQLATSYYPSQYNYSAPTVASSGQRYYDMGSRQWVNASTPIPTYNIPWQPAGGGHR